MPAKLAIVLTSVQVREASLHLPECVALTEQVHQRLSADVAFTEQTPQLQLLGLLEFLVNNPSPNN